MIRALDDRSIPTALNDPVSKNPEELPAPPGHAALPPSAMGAGSSRRTRVRFLMICHCRYAESSGKISVNYFTNFFQE